MIREAHGLDWVIHENTDDYLGPSVHESGLVSIAKVLFPAGGTFVDVGAHVGLYALQLAFSNSTGRVVAVEANPKTFDTLCENISLNGLLNVEPERVAVWNSSGIEIDLYDVKGLASGGSTGAVRIGEALQVAKAKTVTLNDLLAAESRVDLIKIDVEGAEVEVLQGSLDALNDFRPTLMIEMHDPYLAYPEANRGEVEHLLEWAGYVHGEDIPYGGAYHWVCRPREQK